MPGPYHVGQLVRLPLSFTVSGVATDPSTITLRVKDPTGAITSYAMAQLVKDSTGNYHIDILMTIPGTWAAHCESTGAAQTGGDDQFVVTVPVA